MTRCPARRYVWSESLFWATVRILMITISKQRNFCISNPYFISSHTATLLLTALSFFSWRKGDSLSRQGLSHGCGQQVLPECADYVFVNSSVRGPILPWYAQKTQHWTELFTQKITKSVKLVGPSISCEHYCIRERGKLRCRKNAHVQSVAFATDQACANVPC
jgi:hypothetical protein